MVCIKPLPTKRLNSLFSSPSPVASSSLSSSTSTSASTTFVQSDEQQGSEAAAVTSSTCKRRIRRKSRGATALFMVLLDLSIIVLITTTGTPTTVSAVSIAAVSIASNAYGDGKGNGGVSQQQHHHQPGQPPQPHKLTFLSGNDAKGNGSTVGVLNLSFGELLFASKRQQQQPKKKEMDGKPIKNKRIVKRAVGDTRITSNQDVTTLALAVDNSSSVAIANINSSFNNVYVSIGSNAFPKVDSGNRFDTHLDEEDEDDEENE